MINEIINSNIRINRKSSDDSNSSKTKQNRLTAALIKQFNNSSESQNNTSAQKSNKVKASTRQLINKFNGNGNKGFGSSTTMMKNNNNVNMSKNFSSTPGENRQTSEKSAMSSNVQKMVSAFNQSGFIHNNQ